MSDTVLSKAYFEKSIQSIRLSLLLLTKTDLNSFSGSAIGELFHGFELLLKGLIVRHNKYLLIQDTKTAVEKNWTVNNFDELISRSANELPKLLFALEGAGPSVLFIKDNYELIEKMRRERNSYEHSAKSVSANYISLIIAPFFHKIILGLFDLYGEKYQDYFSDDDRLDLFEIIDDPTTLLPDKNKFHPVSHNCPLCFNSFAFVSKNNDELHCLVCNKSVITQNQIKFSKCPICEDELISYPNSTLCLGDCRQVFIDDDIDLAVGQKCNCHSVQFFNLYDQTGNEEGFCLNCLTVVDLWMCDFCKKYRLEESKCEPPEEMHSSNLCEDCDQDVHAAYRVD